MLRHRERLVRLSLSLFILFHAITQSTARGYKMSSGTFDFFVRRGETKGENVFFKKVTHIIILRCAPGNWRKGKNGNGARVITIFRNVIKCKKEGEKERKKEKNGKFRVTGSVCWPQVRFPTLSIVFPYTLCRLL